ncbi:MAG: PilX N-terminal domain-containing pilus assembly protein [Steroidobacteraceae bacterium]
MSTYRKPPLRRRSSQTGMALISGLLLLVVVTILAMSMFRSYGTQQKIAGNVREKQRAVSAATSAQQYAEYWLSTSPSLVAIDCSDIGVSAVGQVCSNAPDFTTVPWSLAAKPVGVTFSNFKLLSQVNHTASKATYFDTPLFYITDLGQSAAGPGEVYQIDATAYGGTSETVAVVESTYLLAPAGRNYDK